MKTILVAPAICILMLASSAQAGWTCRCVDGKLKTSTCLGYCQAHLGVAEQARKDFEAAEKKLPGLH